MTAKILVRYTSEIMLKRQAARTRFIQLVKRNVTSNLEKRGISFELKAWHSGMMVETDSPEEVRSVLEHTFGVGLYSPIKQIALTDLKDITEKAAEMIPEVSGRTFAVRAKRDQNVPYRSKQIECAIGDILSKHGKVNLSNPEVTIHVHMTEHDTWIYTEKHKCEGGFPVTGKDRALVLISGGFDSVVAAWKVLKRGVAVDFLFCNFGGKADERMVLQIVKVLHMIWGEGTSPRLFVADFTKVTAELKSKVNPGYRQVILKRRMLKTAEMLCRKTHCDAIVTGEVIGQVSSQTLRNLRAIEEAVSLPVLRPIISMEKDEIIKEARRIGTASLSERVVERCDLTSGSKPSTGLSLAKVRQGESELQDSIIEDSFNSVREFDIVDLKPEDLSSDYLFIDDIPENHIVIDCQDEAMYDAWHYPEAEHFEFDELVKSYRTLNKYNNYVVYCTFGSKTPFIAELMQQDGYRAYAFRGGLSKLQRIADEL